MLGEVAHQNTCSGEKRSSRSRALEAPGGLPGLGAGWDPSGLPRPSTGLLWLNGGRSARRSHPDDHATSSPATALSFAAMRAASTSSKVWPVPLSTAVLPV